MFFFNKSTLKILFFIVEVYDKTWRFLVVFICSVSSSLFTECLFVWWCLTPLLVISWLSVLLVEETGGPHVTDKLYHIMLYTSPWSITATATPQRNENYFSGACLALHIKKKEYIYIYVFFHFHITIILYFFHLYIYFFSFIYYKIKTKYIIVGGIERFWKASRVRGPI